MARTPFAERPTSLKVLGAAFVALMLFFLWLTFAFFNKTFVDYDNVTLVGPKAGLNLPENADIKLRGMIVGEVRGIESDRRHHQGQARHEPQVHQRGARRRHRRDRPQDAVRREVHLPRPAGRTRRARS